MSQKRAELFIVTGLLFLLAVALALPTPSAMASPSKVGEQIPVIMVGDRLVDAAHSLGVVPVAMVVRCSMWPMCDKLKSSVQVLGCPECLLKKKLDPLFKYGEKHGIKKVFIEKSMEFCAYKKGLDLEKIGDLAKAGGYEVSYVDFTQGLDHAVQGTAELIGQKNKAVPAMGKYRQAMEKTLKFIKNKTFVKNVVIIRGTYQAASGKTFLRIESPNGYADKFMLDPLGINNVGQLAVPQGKTPSKGHIQVRKLTGLIAAAPDAIIMTGDAQAVQKAIYRAVKKNPALAGVPALKGHALFSLPGYVDASVMEYPGVLKQWADFLAL
ncbi:substrate-binding protein [Desulfocicer vacuolatum DSM 3385]|uniref:Substrate-binding protein n=1 Tax=Desulfocicer vacuolatum DSM 3385 TaxID=1121400 RepID=A0A1W1YSP0_9BACT|nr:ABC transporter substrate-binding protein [Desulfocicer vacuolatum]SMC39154.1 substrate-binding protein [Desulfocicer vacuolatum DSM 3385]